MCEEMENLIRRFVWGGSKDRKGIALIPWTKMQQPSNQGGLGFRDLHKKNKAFLMKIGYGLILNNDSLWVQVLKTKYRWDEVLPMSIDRPSSSRLWKGICSEGRLAFSCLLPTSPRPILVADMVDNDGNWDWSRMEATLPLDIIQRIATILTPSDDDVSDIPVWRNGANAECGMEVHLEGSGATTYPSFFLWLVFHDRLFTNVERVRMHLVSSDLCNLCGRGREDLEHVLRSCIMARNVWLWAIPTEMRHIFFTLPFTDWLHKNLFEHSFMPNPQHPDIQSRWVAPFHGSVKLNVDAAVSPTDHTAGVGGVIRDENGYWILGFARFVGRCDVLIVELWAIHDGLSDALISSALVASIKELLTRAWTVVVRHVNRLSNRVADRLAARGRGLGTTQLVFSRPLADMVSLMEEDLLVSGEVHREAVGIG
ncbi:hypothetical protein GQ457_02G042600 [Hibiscus cannabinus]